MYSKQIGLFADISFWLQNERFKFIYCRNLNFKTNKTTINNVSVDLPYVYFIKNVLNIHKCGEDIY